MPMMVVVTIFIPAYLAARGLVPTVRRFNPQVVLKSTHHTRAGKSQGDKEAQVKADGGLEKLRNLRGFFDKGTDGHTTRAGAGHRTSQQLGREPVSDIVHHDTVDHLVPAGCGFQQSGIIPQSAPPSAPARKASGM